MPASEAGLRAGAFTLVELILVMALLCLVMAFSAPALSRSMRGRHVTDEAQRFLALTEYARDEAISRGLPTRVWTDPGANRFGMETQPGFASPTNRDREFTTGADVQIEVPGMKPASPVTAVLEFTPDGFPAEGGAEAVRIFDRFGNEAVLERTPDRLGFQMAKGAR